MLMATTMTSSYIFFLPTCIINIILTLTAIVASSKTSPAKPPRLTIKLIHRDSIQSPYYNPSATVSERAEHAINCSFARIRSFSKIIATSNDDDVRAGLIPDSYLHGFMANVSIGMPPVPQLVLIDTASGPFWIQCLPCTACFRQTPPLFDPIKSSTYSNVLCGSLACLKLGAKCDPSKKFCVYHIRYYDKSSSSGNLASEQATFETSDEGTVKVPNEGLGCGHVNKQSVDGQYSGVLGLGSGDGVYPTVVKQFGSKFSYCIGNIRDPQYQYNQLILGDGSIMQGDPSTLENHNELYYVDVQGISVGEKQLPIDPSAFKRDRKDEGGVIIDSGSTFTFLMEMAFGPLQNEVESLMAGKLNRVSDPSFLCYAGSVERDLMGFPVVTLQFSGGAELGLEINSLFFQLRENVLCMTIVQSPPDNDISIIGVLAQQSYNIGYDVGQGKIFFQRIDCSLLESLDDHVL